MKISTKLLLAFVIIALIPLGAISIWSYVNANEALTSQVLSHLESVAEIQRNRIESIVEQNLERLSLVSSRTQLRISLDRFVRNPNPEDRDKINRILLDARPSVNSFRDISVLTPDGKVIASTNPTKIGSTYLNEEVFIKGRKENTGDIFFLDKNQSLCVYLSGPLYLKDKLLGVVIIESTADSILSSIEDYTGLGTTGETVLAEKDENGDAVFITPVRFDKNAALRRTEPKEKVHSPVTQALLKNEKLFTDTVDYRGEPVLAATKYVPKTGWGLVTKIDKAEALAPAAYLRSVLITIIFLSLALVLFVSLFLARTITRPIIKLMHMAVKVSKGDLTERAEITSRDEVGILAQACNQMKDSLVKTNSDLERELAERKRAEKQIINLNSVLRVLRDVNQLIVHEKNRERLIRKSCDFMEKSPGFLCAWVLLFDEKKKYVSAAVAGNKEMQAFLQELKQENYPLCIDRILSHKHSFAVCNDIVENEAGCPPKNYYGDGTGLISRLEYEGRVYGIFSAYVPSNYAFDPEEQSLFKELAGDIAFALAGIEKEEQRTKMEQALVKSEAGLAEAQRIAHIGSWELDIVSNTLTWSDEVYRIFNLEPQQFGATYEAFLDNIHPDDREMVDEAYTRSVRNKTPYNIVHRLLLKDSTLKYINERCETFYDHGKPVLSIGTVQDITELSEAEKAFIEGEEKYRALFENALDGIVLYDAETGAIVDCNQGFEQETGRRLAQLSDLTMWELRPAELVEPTRQIFNEIKQNGRIGPIESAYERPDGEIVSIEYSSKLITVRGRPYIQSVARDITERKYAEEALRQSKERYHNLFDNTSDLIQSVTPDGRILYANKAWHNTLGYSEKETADLRLWDIIHPDSLPHCEEVFQRVMSGEAANDIEVVFMAKDGKLVMVEGNAHCHIDHGKPAATQGIFRDVTERRRAEETLQQSEEKLRRMFQSVTDGIMVTDLNGIITDVNERVLQMHGLGSKGEIVGKSALELIAPSDHERARLDMQRTLENGSLRDIEYTLLKADGLEFPGEVSSSVLKNASGRPAGFIALTRDITERHKMAEQLMATDRLASVGELASGIAHELNNPLTGVIGLSELLLEKEVPGHIAEDLKVIRDEAQRAAQVIKNLLTFARKHPVSKEPVSVNEVIEKVLTLRAYEQKVNNIQVDIHLSPGLPKVLGDYFQLQQVFLNIIINAEYFMTQSHGKGALTIATRQEGGIIHASFADNGPGISKENLKYLFTPFFTTKEVGKGTGLGLSICHGIVRAHNGRIYAESEVGEGAVFVVELPLEPHED